MEMYSTDWSGRYPRQLDQLVPKYLEELPVCPAAGGMSYELEYGLESPHNKVGFKDYYYLYCGGRNHSVAGLGADEPGYDGVSSGCER